MSGRRPQPVAARSRGRRSRAATRDHPHVREKPPPEGLVRVGGTTIACAEMAPPFDPWLALP